MNLKRITINPDQTVCYMHAATPLGKLGYEYIEELSNSNQFVNWDYVFAKDNKLYALESWFHFNTTIYEINLLEFDNEDELNETDVELSIENFLNEHKDSTITLNELDADGLECFGGGAMEEYDEETYYSEEYEDYSFAYGYGDRQIIVEYTFIDRNEEDLMETTVEVTGAYRA